MSNVEQSRQEWLEVARKMVVAMFRRHSMEQLELCPESRDPDTDCLRKYSDLKIRVASASKGLREVEERAKRTIGILALLGDEPAPSIRCAVVLILGKALSPTVATRVDDVAEVAEYAVGNQSPEDLLTIRQSFARDGVLRPHVVMQMSRTLCQCRRVFLSEKALSVVLGLPCSASSLEFDILNERGWRE